MPRSPVHFYRGKATRLIQPAPTPEEATRRINSMFDAGQPLFTKEVLRHVGQQLTLPLENGQTLSVKGIDGVAVEFVIETGNTLRLPFLEPGYEYIVQDPRLQYVTSQRLAFPNPLVPRNDDLLYCNVQIYHRRILRNIITKECRGIVQIRSLSDTREIFANNSQIWNRSSQCEQVKSILMSITVPVNIRKIVAFGLGTIAARWPPCSPAGSSLQHALVLTLQDILHKKEQQQQQQQQKKAQSAHTVDTISCYSQDPNYTSTDKTLLFESGITVLEDPDGFLAVDQSTVVVSCAPDAPVKQIVSDIAYPAIMVWNRVKDEDQIFRGDPDSPRLRKMVVDMYDVIEFPENTGDFVELMIYVRKSDIQSLDASIHRIHKASGGGEVHS